METPQTPLKPHRGVHLTMKWTFSILLDPLGTFNLYLGIPSGKAEEPQDTPIQNRGKQHAGTAQSHSEALSKPKKTELPTYPKLIFQAPRASQARPNLEASVPFTAIFFRRRRKRREPSERIAWEFSCGCGENSQVPHARLAAGLSKPRGTIARRLRRL